MEAFYLVAYELMSNGFSEDAAIQAAYNKFAAQVGASVAEAWALGLKAHIAAWWAR